MSKRGAFTTASAGDIPMSRSVLREILRGFGTAIVATLSLLVIAWYLLGLLFVVEPAGWTSGSGRVLMAVLLVLPAVLALTSLVVVVRRGRGLRRALVVAATSGLVAGVVLLPISLASPIVFP